MIRDDFFQKIKGKKLLLCVSGGIDSMVLLHYFNSVKNVYDLHLLVCHFEHGIRGDESYKDMLFVEKNCKDMGIDFFCKRENILKDCQNENVEAYARNRRYQFFFDTLKKTGADYIVVAHHMLDNCETVLMNIIRGCGSFGLCGIFEENGKILRPFLKVSKGEIIAYAKENKVDYKDDSTNFDITYLRNNIRLNLIPQFEKINPKFVESLCRLSDIMKEENDFFDQYVACLPWIEKRFYGYDILVDDFLKSHDAIKKRSVFFVLKNMMEKDFSSRDFFDIIELFKKQTGKKVILSKEVIAYRCYDKVAFYKVQQPILNEYTLKIGKNETPFGTFFVSRVAANMDEIKKAKSNVAYFDGDVTFTVRKRKDGDAILCFDRKRKKVKDLFVDKKIEAFLRDRYPMVLIGDDIAFIPFVAHSKVKMVKGENVTKIEFTF